MTLNPNSIYTLTYDEAKAAYADTDIEWLDKKLIISIRNSDRVGLYKLSDIIVKYGSSDRLPVIIAERIYKKNYGVDEYKNKINQWRRKIKYTGTENTFRIELSVEKGYADYIYYSKEWLQRELKSALRI